MGSGTVITVVGTRCKPEVEDRFNAWYDQAHLPTLFTFPGLRRSARYRLIPPLPNAPMPGSDPWLPVATLSERISPYLAISEFVSREAHDEYERTEMLAQERHAMREIWKDGGWAIEWKASFETLKSWER
jgi:hypothetical protein